MLDLPAPGQSPRRAQALVFLIEQEAARTRDLRSAAIVASVPSDVSIGMLDLLDETARTLPAPSGDDLEDLAAYQLARRDVEDVNGRMLERTADVWAPLVPAVPALRAQALLILLDRHQIVAESSPRIRAAFGADTDEVRQAFEALGRGRLDEHFAAPSGIQRLMGRFRR